MNEIRFDLGDIIKSNFINQFVDLINLAHKEIVIKKVIFWHNGNVKENELYKFTKKLNNIDSHIIIKFSNDSPQEEFVWFDVISEDKFKHNQCRFSHIYSKKSEIVNGIYNFLFVSRFIEKRSKGKRIHYKKEE